MAMWTPVAPSEKHHLLKWAQARLPVREFGEAYPVGVVRDGELAAVCVYHQLRAGNIEMSIAADTPRWATRQVITFLLGWPFWVHEVRRLTAIVALRNERSLRLVKGLGFVQEGVMRHLFPRDHGVVLGMLHKDWRRSRWYAEPHGSQQARAA